MSRHDIQLPIHDIPSRPMTVGFLLIPGFALMSYASAVEPLRAANILSGRELYRWSHISSGETLVEASNGLAIVADYRIGEALKLDAVLVCAGGNPALFDHPPTLRWLRGLKQKRITVGGVSGGPYLLARAGLLDGRRCTIHWEHAAAFSETFPQIALKRTLYEIDGDRLTCSGGIAALDMMTTLIERDHGRTLAREVGDWFIQTRVRPGSGPQRMHPRERYGATNPHLVAALQAMEARIEVPSTREELAELAGTGLRQLERLFADHLGSTIATHYLGIRLERARSLIHETTLPVIEVAIACGFRSASHFSRSFKARYGISPRNARGKKLS